MHVPDLEMYLRNTTNFTSPSAQMEMAEVFSHQILRTIISEIQQNEFYAVTADGTQDVAGQEQESFVLRHVDSDLYVHEDFIGLYLMFMIKLIQHVNNSSLYIDACAHGNSAYLVVIQPQVVQQKSMTYIYTKNI